MTDQLLATKFYVPTARANIVNRSQLIERLNDGVQHGHRLTLVSAPAGFGKTTLVASWLITSAPIEHFKKCWLALDSNDSTPSSFVAYFVSAIQTASPQIGNVARAVIESAQTPPLETILVSLVNDIAALNEQIIFVLDDYHVITNPDIHHALDFFIDHLPPNFHLVMTTRQDPPLALARLRVRGQLTEIRAANLQFSPIESDEFLNRLMSLGLTETDVTALSERTEGWIAGLRLAALALENENDKHKFINAFTASNRFLTDYLLDEVLSRQEPQLYEFLLRTSILHRFSAAMCDSVVGDNIGTPMLRRLEQSNLFLVPLDRERQWFRYHHLFAQFLQMRLKESEPHLISTLYQRAMDWCIAQGLEREALAYALESHDNVRAAELIEKIAPQVLSTAGASQVLEWLAVLPEAFIKQRPYLCLHYTWALSFVAQMAQADEYLALAETASARESDEQAKKIILGYIAAHRAYLDFFRGEYQHTIENARFALARIPQNDNVIRARTLTLLAHGLRYAGNFTAAIEAHELASSVSEKTGNLYTATFNLSGLQELYRERGQLRLAMAICEQTLDFARRRVGRTDMPFCGFTYFEMGVIEREWNHLDRAREYSEQGEKLCREWHQGDALAIGLMGAAFVYQDLGEYALARQALEEAKQIIGTMFSAWGAAMANAFIAQLDVARGDVEAANRWMQTCGLSIRDEIPFIRQDDYQALAQVLTVQEKFADALVVWDKLYQLLKSSGRIGRLFQVALWRARALAGAHRRADALDALKEMLAYGESENFVRSFVSAGPVSADLLRELPTSDYRNRLLDAFPQSPSANLLEPLSERELEILHLIQAGYSNQEIADKLVITLNTVKKHTSNLFGKLGVTSRTLALARAHELGLL